MVGAYVRYNNHLSFLSNIHEYRSDFHRILRILYIIKKHPSINKVALFGSFLKDPGKANDIDILVIKNKKEESTQKILAFFKNVLGFNNYIVDINTYRRRITSNYNSNRYNNSLKLVHFFIVDYERFIQLKPVIKEYREI